MRNWLTSLAIALTVVATAAAQSPTPPPIDLTRAQGISETRTGQGFAQFGSSQASASVVVFAAVDDPASVEFWAAGMATLIERARAADILLTAIPVVRGVVNGAIGATRGAICAGEQAAYFAYLDHIYSAARDLDPAGFGGDRLINAVETVGLDLVIWQECMISDRPDTVLEQSRLALDDEVNFTTLPYVTVNGVSALTTPDSLNFTIDLAVRQMADRQNTPTPDPDVTPDLEVVTLDPLMGDQVEPPLTLTLPAGWRAGYDVLVLQDIDAIRNIPFAVYTGPVTGGTGTIILLWAFPNLVIGSPVQGEVAPDLWVDGTRLLRLAIVEDGCNIGTDLRREYAVGGLTAVGTSFAAVTCPQLPDTRGWFAGLQQFELNFIFYAYTEPIAAMDGAAVDELQAILDSVRFVRPPTPTPTATPDAAATAEATTAP